MVRLVNEYRNSLRRNTTDNNKDLYPKSMEGMFDQLNKMKLFFQDVIKAKLILKQTEKYDVLCQIPEIMRVIEPLRQLENDVNINEIRESQILNSPGKLSHPTNIVKIEKSQQQKSTSISLSPDVFRK